MSWDDASWALLETRWEAGFEQLWPQEQQTLALWWLVSETMNGTMDQFFWNSSGDLALLAQAGLQRLNLPKTLAALNAALAQFGPAYPTDRDARMAQLKQLEATLGEAAFATLFSAATDVIQAYTERCDEVAVNDLRPRYVAAGLLA